MKGPAVGIYSILLEQSARLIAICAVIMNTFSDEYQ